jgi:hypothetical protein
MLACGSLSAERDDALVNELPVGDRLGLGWRFANEKHRRRPNAIAMATSNASRTSLIEMDGRVHALTVTRRFSRLRNGRGCALALRDGAQGLRNVEARWRAGTGQQPATTAAAADLWPG